MKLRGFLFLLTFLVVVLPARGMVQEDAAFLPLNIPAPKWEVSDWMYGPPLELRDLRGKVVLVRWWTGPGCPFCIKSVDALNELYKDYFDDNLMVIGFYHHKSSLTLDKKKVMDYYKDMGFRFPVAIDHDWKTLKKWWLYGPRRSFTSVSFLLDKTGVIRYIHPGGEIVKGDSSYRELVARIQTLLEEETSGARHQ